MGNNEGYKFLSKQEFNKGVYSIVPIRFQDRKNIMDWRNEQIYHLRQLKPLTIEDQDTYFNTTIKSLFTHDSPNQILFSYLENNRCIGYGGLVHINWSEKTGEISFIMDTSLEKENFALHWTNFLHLIENIAFGELNFRYILTYAYDLRPHLYPILERCGFKKENILKGEHMVDGQPLDVVIHTKHNTSPK